MKTPRFWALCLLAVLIWTNLRVNLAFDEQEVVAEKKQPKETELEVQKQGTAKTKNAFATIHYEGTPRDDEYLLGIRVLIKSVRMAGQTEDFLVLVTESVKHETRKILTDAGAKVIEVASIENPYKSDPTRRRSYQSRFDQTLIKLHVWNQLAYDRILYMDADNIVLNPVNNLWNCGHFCAIFMNVAVFHTGLLVIKPDEAVYNDMLRSLASVESYDGADQGFFVGYFKNMEYSPLWNDSQPFQSQDKTNRMPINYNMNHIYYYEKSNWDFYRRGEFKELTIPAITLGFPITPILKPWYWHPYLFLQVHWKWQSYRNELEDSWAGSFWFGVMLLALVVGLVEWRSSKNQSPPLEIIDQPNGNNSPFRTFLWPLSVLGVGWSSFLFGLLSSLISAWLALRLVPAMMPPSYALPLFSFTQITLTFVIFLRLFYFLYGCTPPLRSTMFTMALTSFTVQVCSFYVMNSDYSNPVSKIWSLLLSLQASVGIQVYFFIKCGYLIAVQMRRLGITHAATSPNINTSNNNHLNMRTVRVDDE